MSLGRLIREIIIFGRRAVKARELYRAMNGQPSILEAVLTCEYNSKRIRERDQASSIAHAADFSLDATYRVAEQLKPGLVATKYASRNRS